MLHQQKRGGTYAFLPNRARLLARHARYVAHARDALGGGRASEVVEALLLGGTMTAEDAIRGAWESARRRRGQSDDGGGGGGGDVMDDDGDDDDTLLRSAIALAFCKLVEGGYRVPAVPYV